MLRKIREGVFETNSSSVHTITIRKRSKDIDTILVSDNILYPDVFHESGTPVDHFLGPGTQWTANSIAEKAALLFLYLNHIKDLGTPDYDIEKLNEAIDYLKSKLPYNNIVMGDKYIETYEGQTSLPFDFSHMFDEYEKVLFEDIKKKLLDPFLEVILDEDRYIVVCQGQDY